MTQRLASDPAGQAIVIELMLRLFFIHVLGVRPDSVGWSRGAAPKSAQLPCTDGCAANEGLDSILGPILAAFGPIEAQGRGSLHPHILVWLLVMSVESALDMLCGTAPPSERA